MMAKVMIPLVLSFFVVLYLFIHSQKPVKEFKVNEYIKLKLQNGRTNIYVKNRIFRQCMYLLLNLQINKIHKYDNIESIDEAAEKLDRSMERNPRVRQKITPEEEFIGHCSNIQAWADNDYDTRILHRNLAFPLLKRLTDVGDPMARKKFKEEIALRYASGHPTVMKYLTQRGYLNYLNKEEFESIIDDLKSPLISDISSKVKFLLKNPKNEIKYSDIYSSVSKLLRALKFKHGYLLLTRVIKDLPNELRKKFTEIICNKFQNRKYFPMREFVNYIETHYDDIRFKYVLYEDRLIGFLTGKALNLRKKNISEIKKIEGVDQFCEDIEEIDLSRNLINSLEGLEIFPKLHTLKLNFNQLKDLNGLKMAPKIKVLELNSNQITNMSLLTQLRHVKNLSLKNNAIKEIIDLQDFKELEYLDLSGNSKIKKIPDSLLEHPSLKVLKLSGCHIKHFSKPVSKYFWMESNYSYYSNYKSKDIIQYQKTFNKNALYGNRLYKHFVKWLMKIRPILKNLKCGYRQINEYESETNNKAIWSGRATKSFIKWLDDQKQMRITDFL